MTKDKTFNAQALIAQQLLKQSQSTSNPLAAAIGGFLGARGLRDAERMEGQRLQERELEQQQLKSQLAQSLLGQNATPEQVEQVSQLSEGQLQKALAGKLFPEKVKPQSSFGKLFEDVRSGAIPQDFATSVLSRELAPRQPLVQVGGETETTRQKERAKLTEGRFNKFIENIQEADESALERLTTLEATKQSLENIAAKGGAIDPLTEGKTMLQAVAQGFGVKVGDISNINDIQQLTAQSRKLTIPLAKQLGVNPTDNDFQRILESTVSPTKAIEVNFALQNMAQQKATLDRNKADLVNNILLDDPQAKAQDVRRAVRRFENDNKVKVPKFLNPKEKYNVGDIVSTSRGLFIYDGEGFVKQ